MMRRRYGLKRQHADPRDLVYVPGASAPASASDATAAPAATSTASATGTPPGEVRGGVGSPDLRPVMPPVLDQGQISTCAANATANALRYLLGKEHAIDFAPSRLYLYWYVRVLMGIPPDVDSGSDMRTMCRAVKQFHVAEETAWPYDPSPELRYMVCPDASAVAQAVRHSEVQYVSVRRDITHIHDCLAAGFPIVMGMIMHSTFESEAVALTGQVPMPGPDDVALGGHAVLMCGMDAERQVFIIQNSWGPAWGMAGYFTLPFAYILDPHLTFDLWTYRLFA